jgi:hypothetical protein
MNHPVDMHPEDLLDREQCEALSVDEQRRLDSHCRQCSSCAILRAVTLDFARERQLNTADPVMLDRLVEAAMENGSPVTARYAPVSFVPRRKRRTWAVTAVVMFAATGAAASFSSVRQAVMQRTIEPVMHAFYEPRIVPAAAVPPAPKKIAAATAPKAFEPVPERIVPPPLPATLNVRPPAREVIAPQPKVKVAEVVTTAVTAEQLMKAVDEARVRHDTAQMQQFYGRLQRQFPGSAEEVISTYTVGRQLYVSGEDVPGALELFNRYLAESPNGTLAEDARAGRAKVLQRLGRTAEERQAWLDLLSAYPRSAYAVVARRRLDQLR